MSFRHRGVRGERPQTKKEDQAQVWSIAIAVHGQPHTAHGHHHLHPRLVVAHGHRLVRLHRDALALARQAVMLVNVAVLEQLGKKLRRLEASHVLRLRLVRLRPVVEEAEEEETLFYYLVIAHWEGRVTL